MRMVSKLTAKLIANSILVYIRIPKSDQMMFKVRKSKAS